LAAGQSQILTAEFYEECPSYFAHFEAQTVLARMISGLEKGEESGKLLDKIAARAFFEPILSAGPGDHFGDGREPTAWKLQLDLMNRLQDATAAWIIENKLEFSKPKVVAFGSEQLAYRFFQGPTPIPEVLTFSMREFASAGEYRRGARNYR
jgi:hypothetical protein